MSLHQKDSGTRVTAANIGDVTDAVADTDPLLVVLEDLIQRREYEGGNDATAATGDDYVTKAFKAGEKVRTSVILAMLTPAEVDSITPANGAAAGGTALTIKGSGLDGVTAVTIGGVATTSLVVVDSETVTCTTGAHSAGVVNVVIADDAGAVTVTNGFTYA